MTTVARENPFTSERLEALRYIPLHWTWEEMMFRLDEMAYRGAIVGPEGSGKTTLLLDLAARLQKNRLPTRPPASHRRPTAFSQWPPSQFLFPNHRKAHRSLRRRRATFKIFVVALQTQIPQGRRPDHHFPPRRPPPRTRLCPDDSRSFRKNSSANSSAKATATTIPTPPPYLTNTTATSAAH